VAVASSGPYANLHLAPDSTTPLSFLQAGCPSCHPTNSVKALKGKTSDNSYLQLQIVVLCSKIPSLEHLYNSIKSVRLGYQSLIFLTLLYLKNNQHCHFFCTFILNKT